MGTKIEYAINVLEASQSSNQFLGQNCADDWGSLWRTNVKVKCSTNRIEDGVRTSMDKMLVNYNVDSIKKTMQMHEDVFKHQVKELHRLYSIQKMLMDDLAKELKQRNIWGPMNGSNTSNSQLTNWQFPATKLDIASADTFNCIQSLKEDQSYAECSGSCSGDAVRTARGFDLERPVEEVMSTGVSAVGEDQSNQISKPKHMNSKLKLIVPDEDVELTLCIGSSLSKTRTACNRRQIEELNSSASFKSDRGGESDPATPLSSSSATFDQERKQPHWLFHGLKLK